MTEESAASLELNSVKLLAKCMTMIRESGICPKTPISEWPGILLFAHVRGYLYTNKDASCFAMAYRIPEWDEKWSNTMPESESGDKAFIAFAVKDKKDRFGFLKMLKAYIRETGVKEIYYYRRNSDTDLRKINLRRSHAEV